MKKLEASLNMPIPCAKAFNIGVRVLNKEGVYGQISRSGTIVPTVNNPKVLIVKVSKGSNVAYGLAVARDRIIKGNSVSVGGSGHDGYTDSSCWRTGCNGESPRHYYIPSVSLSGSLVFDANIAQLSNSWEITGTAPIIGDIKGTSSACVRGENLVAPSNFEMTNNVNIEYIKTPHTKLSLLISSENKSGHRELVSVFKTDESHTHNSADSWIPDSVRNNKLLLIGTP